MALLFLESYYLQERLYAAGGYNQYFALTCSIGLFTLELSFAFL